MVTEFVEVPVIPAKAGNQAAKRGLSACVTRSVPSIAPLPV